MRNWTIKEAVEVINANQDQEAIKEVAKHFPQAFMAICKNDLVALTQAMNEKFTLRRLQFTAAVEADTEDDGDETDAPTAKVTGKKAPAKAAEAAVEADDTDLSTMTAKQLMKLCDDKGIKVPHYGKSKQFYLDALAGGAEESVEAEVEQEDTEAAVDTYEGKTAMELYKLCKKRGIKAEPKKSTKVYIAALKKADEATAEEDTDAEDEGWSEEEEEEAPKKAPTKAAPAKKAPKKAPAKDEEEDAGDDDEEWDI